MVSCAQESKQQPDKGSIGGDPALARTADAAPPHFISSLKYRPHRIIFATSAPAA